MKSTWRSTTSPAFFPARSTQSLLARQAGVALLYFAAAKAGLMFAVVGNTVTLAWPPSGIALVAILAFGYRITFGIALGAILANAWTGLPILLAVGIAIGKTLEALTGAFLLKQVAHFRNTLGRRRDVFALIILAATCSTTISAFIGMVTLILGGVVASGEYATVWLKWWLGDMMGVLVVAPLLLIWLTHSRPVLSWRKTVEAMVLFATLLVMSHKIFDTPELAGHGYYPASLAVFPFVIWGALRFDQWGAALVTGTISVLAIWGTSQGTGPFVIGSPVDNLIGWCIFVNVVAVTGLLLAASSVEQRRSHANVKSARDELEQRVRERTAELAKINAGLKQEMEERIRLEGELIRLEERQLQQLGRELHDGLGQQLTSIAFFTATLWQQMEEQKRAEASTAQRIAELVNQTIDVVRATSRSLYPVALESSGLPAALKQLAESTHLLKGISCDFLADPQLKVDDPLVAINLYRIAQEAVNNALKHSHASYIGIEFGQHADGRHRLTIIDNGVGFEPAKIVEGMGLCNLRYRASLLAGDLSIDGNPEGGTTVAVSYPAQA